MTGQERGGDQEEVRRALATFVKLLRATETVSANVHRQLAGSGLTVSQFAVLEVLWHRGPLCQRDIGRKILKSGGNITLVIDNLERHGWVRRTRTASDRRFFSVALTPAGRALIERIFPPHAARVVAELAILTPAEQDELARLCRKLGRREPAESPTKGERPC